MSTADNLPALIRPRASALDIPELRRWIFEFAEKATLARCASVCSTWSNCALDYLWKELHDIRPLLEILSPLKLELDGLLYFQTRLTECDWERFLSYAQRVRELIINDHLLAEPSTEVVTQLFHRGSTVCFTPKLTKLAVWSIRSVSLDISVLFMSDSLTELSFRLTENQRKASEFFTQVVARASRLKRIDYLSMLEQYLDLEVAEMFSHLPELEIVHLPITASEAQSEAALSRLPKVEGTFWSQTHGYRLKRVYFLQSSPHGFFTSLTELWLTAPLSDVTKLISFTPNLRSLDLYSCSFEKDGTLHSFLETISRSCGSLLSLKIDTVSFLRWSSTPISDISAHGRHYFPSKPCTPLSFPKLTVFTLYWPVPLIFGDDELVQFISAFPLILELRLNGHPFMLDLPRLTPAILHEIARMCPKIRHLSLYVNCTLGTPDLSDSCTTSVFENLEVLDLGASPINEMVNPFSRYLSKLCKSSCDFVSTDLNEFNDITEEGVEVEYGRDRLEGTWAREYRNIKELARLIRIDREEVMHSVTRERDTALEEGNIFMGKWKAAESENLQLKEQKDETGGGTVAGSSPME